MSQEITIKDIQMGMTFLFKGIDIPKLYQELFPLRDEHPIERMYGITWRDIEKKCQALIEKIDAPEGILFEDYVSLVEEEFNKKNMPETSKLIRAFLAK